MIRTVLLFMSLVLALLAAFNTPARVNLFAASFALFVAASLVV